MTTHPIGPAIALNPFGSRWWKPCYWPTTQTDSICSRSLYIQEIANVDTIKRRGAFRSFAIVSTSGISTETNPKSLYSWAQGRGSNDQGFSMNLPANECILVTLRSEFPAGERRKKRRDG